MMHYEPIERNAKHVNALSRAMKKAKALYLATDPDREGEAISWHVAELLRDAKVLDGKPVRRVVFHEITKRAIDDAIANPREISTSLVNAQQARRALDYLVGFNLSPLLWKKIRKGLSAGTGPEPGAADDCRARAGNRAIREARVLDHRGRPRKRRCRVHRKAGAVRRRQGRAVHHHGRSSSGGGAEPAGRVERRHQQAHHARSGRR